MSIFGDFVKLRREELRLDQVALARQLEVLRVDVSDLMRYAGYLAEGDPKEVQAKEPLHDLLGQVGSLTDDQLIVLIDQAWEEYRGRLGFNLEDPRRRGGGTAPG